MVNNISEKTFFRLSLAAVQLLKEIKKRKLFGYVQCDIRLLENLRSKFAEFPPIFRSALVSKSDIGSPMKNFAEKGTRSQPRKIVVSSFTLRSGTLIPLLLLFHLKFGLVCTKVHHFVEYPLKKVFHSFEQSVEDARRHGAMNPFSGVVAETKKLLASSSHGYQVIDFRRLTVTKYLSDKRSHAAVKSKLFKELDHVNNPFYEIELQKAQIEHKEPSIVGFFILQ